MVAARFTWERPGRVIPVSKNIYSVGSTFSALVTVYVSEMGWTGLVVPAKYPTNKWQVM